MYIVIADAENMNSNAKCATISEAKNACGFMLEDLGFEKKDIHIVTPEGKKLYLVPQKKGNK